jgi:hypothetical protein
MKLLNLSVACLFIASFYLSCAWANSYSGMVVNQHNLPVADAIVRLQGTAFSTRTDMDGKFKLDIEKNISATYITAWKSGFYNGGQLISPDNIPYKISLPPIEFADNKAYQWLLGTENRDAAQTNQDGESQPCENCHPPLVKEWKKDAHSGAATNPVFLTFFNGTDIDGNKNRGPGFKIDFENSNGKCVQCHIPTMGLRDPVNPNPNEAAGIDKQGISCDFCHKIDGMHLDQTGGLPGVLSYKFRRPSDGHQLFYGPYDDVYPGEDSYHPLYSKSQYCAPCHHGKFWGVLAYSEFQEWSESTYAKKEIHCQDCHMKPDGKTTRFVSKQKGGIDRDPLTIPSHVNLGITDEAFMKEAISLSTIVGIDNDILKVSVKIENTNAGHHYPTGNPMRNMILLVEVIDEKGDPLTMNRGARVPSWGGEGAKDKGNYAGLPGKGFAKVLKNRPFYGFKQKKDYNNEHPAPHWKRIFIESDNRIPANGYDLSHYEFKLPEMPDGWISITARLIFRRSYKKWIDSKNLDTPDMELGRSSLFVRTKKEN